MATQPIPVDLDELGEPAERVGALVEDVEALLDQLRGQLAVAATGTWQ